MKMCIKAAAVTVLAVVAVSGLCGCSELMNAKNELDGFVSGAGDFVSGAESFRSAIENGNYDQLLSGFDNDELKSILNEIEDQTGLNGREKIDTSDKINTAKGLEKACSGLYAGVIDGRVNSESDTASYSITLPKKDASMSEKIEAAEKLTVDDALVFCSSKDVKLDGIYYLTADVGEDYPKGSIISDTDDYFREAEGHAKKISGSVTLEKLFSK